MNLLVKALCAAAGLALLFRALVAVEKSARSELRNQAEAPFLDTLKQHNISEYDLLHEKLTPGAKGQINKLFEVHRVISDRDSRYYLYIHFESQRPVLQHISRERALAAQRYN